MPGIDRTRRPKRNSPPAVLHPPVAAGNRIATAVASMVLLTLLALHARAQTAGETIPPECPTPKSIQTALKQAEESPDLDDVSKAKVSEAYGQAAEDLETAETWRAKVEQFSRMIAIAPQELAQTRTDLAAVPDPADVAIPNAGLPELEQSLSAKETELAQQKATLAELESEIRRRANRRVEVPKSATTAQELLADTLRQLQAPPLDEPAILTAARRVRLLARQQALEQELASYERELRAYEVRTELLSLRRDLAVRRAAHLEQVVLQWRNQVTRRRYRETETQLRRARQEADQAHPAVEQLAQANARWTERRKELAQLIANTARDLDETDVQLATLQGQFERMQEKVDCVGLTNAIGLLLRNQRDSLPSAGQYWQRIAARQETIRDCQLELLQLKDRRSELANLDVQVEQELLAVGRDWQQADPSELKTSVEGFLRSERDYLDALILDANGYFDRLVDLDNAERQLADRIEAYSAYINERVLWIRSTTAIGGQDFRNLGQGFAWFFRPGNWLELGRALATDAWKAPAWFGSALVIFAALFFWRRRMGTRLSELGDEASRSICCRIAPTLQAVVLTVLSAAAGPGLITFLAWRLGANASESEFIEAVSSGLSSAAGVYLVLELLRQMLRENGLFDAHFDWPTTSLYILRRQCRWSMVVLLPLVFATVAMNVQEHERVAAALGRFGFIAVMTACSLFVWRSLRTAGGVHRHIVAAGQGEWLLRLRPLWYPAAIALPSVLAILAAMGYYYTAQQLAERMIATAYTLLGLILLRSFLLRWVLVRRRKLAMEQAYKRRAASQADETAGNESGVASPIPTIPEPQADLATINMQTRHMVEYVLAMTGVLACWLIWIDVLPALGFLHRVELWHAIEATRATTLFDLGLALLIFATTLIAAKNLPGLLEMLLLHRLPIDAGLRYTIGTVSRYVIIVVGAVVGCQSLGLAWVKVQWLIAAVSVGLGFGLQEIFANFVSGLIILFERPVRVGDVVTVGDVTGVISQIRMRATTITNWDRKEYIVPNKEFITGRLLELDPERSGQPPGHPGRNRLRLRYGIGNPTPVAGGRGASPCTRRAGTPRHLRRVRR